MSDLNGQENVVRLTLRSKGLETLMELPSEPPDIEAREVVRRGNHYLVMWLVPADKLTQALKKTTRNEGPTGPRNACEREVLRALQALGASPEKRFSRVAIEAAMGEIHGASTISLALARLVKSGLVFNPRDHLGYGLSEK